ncbi:TetR/AcrR family transcriptional regulator [Marinitenerispora sediminis]|uniref:TetR/AcrR family transcriptional regulator n=1 Tax=Marinitenerispora sediminis TaxID=1931232 RepID=A0A368T9M9_9ACTN|nr:TetR/AcrR family transcriptional regulator [Marinitenerispora sediminis]RCV52808.1 TetR/AcrR family transcriptional regulator [Marinitenerispora sediminis]RCV59913.1 TetR/AcrR family transcriptional regulator [Marinitenerispora sediminis]RCV61329.1 TetR/AcrR family transcriptional regulator [Marinitenerispora sediminis]
MTTEYSGSGDPVRSMELLWGTREQPSRGPKPRLTVERIVAAAIELADGEGLAALSMRRVARRLGVGTMSLYTYVPGKSELIDLMLDAVAGESPSLSDVPGDWRAKAEAWARAAWARYHRHPWVLQVATSHPVFGPNDVARTESALSALAGVGLTDREVVALLNAVDGYVRGVARASVEAAQVEQRTGVADERWLTERAPLLDKLIDPRRFPTLTRFWTSGVYEEPGDDFEFGLQRLLDGVETLVRSRSGGPR